ncbi:complex I subunit 4 family protein [Telmatobacter bradus]|uniref:complex I subunit 4 family protein n=1 Tax=Telmatobacter bradus TaxID=474953 RepID=UPI003B4288A3
MEVLNHTILTLILLVPLVGALLVALVPDRGRLPNWIALLTTLVSFGLTLHLPAHFQAAQAGFQYEINLPWIESPAINYHVGVDGLSLWFVVLVGLLAPVGVVASWNAIKERRKVFYSLFLIQQTAMVGVFVALDLMLYYGFWELSLVPMAILIAMYGRKDGAKAALKFFLFTFIPSAPLLVAILWIYSQTHSFDYVWLQILLTHGGFSSAALWWASLAFLFAFAVKVPVFPLHGWLSDTFTEAPVALAMVVAGKLGLYSMLRFHIGLFPDQAKYIAPLLIALAVIGILYGACLALVQREFWKLMAYAALSHLSLITLAIYGQTQIGWNAAVFQILSHGVVDAAIFLLLALLEQRYGSTQIESFGGVASRLPRLATYFVIATLAMIGLPMLSGFVGEFLILSSTFADVSHAWAIAAALGVILGAAYMLILVQKIFYGAEGKLPTAAPDLQVGELATLTPLVVLMLVMGVAPALWLQTVEPAVHPPSAQSPAHTFVLPANFIANHSEVLR